MSRLLKAEAVLLAGPAVIAYRVGVKMFGVNLLSRNDLIAPPYSTIVPLFCDLLDALILLAYQPYLVKSFDTGFTS